MGGVTALVFSLALTVVSPEVGQTLVSDLRDLAVKAGCEREQVRVAMRWLGPDKPLEIDVRCAGDGKGTDP